MGCDIHVHLEIEIDGQWHHYNSINLYRNYTLFAKMADVRNDGSITPLSTCRGLPENISVVTKLDVDSWGNDGHSHSWLNAKEISEIISFHRSLYFDIPEHIPEEQWDKYVHEKIRLGKLTESERTAYSNIHSQWGYLFGNPLEGYVKYKTDYPKEVEDIRLIFWFDN